MKLDDDEEIKKDEMDNILDYINDLDYEKYSKDMELREALQLIKNKMNKDKKEDDEKEEEKEGEKEDLHFLTDSFIMVKICPGGTYEHYCFRTGLDCHDGDF